MKRKLTAVILSTCFFSTGVLANAMVDLYKSPSCGCCTQWMNILEEKGYQVKVHHQQQWNDIKQQHKLPSQLVSCHSAVIDGYLIEGHVPEADIARLLAEKPEGIVGLSAPGMPAHSPGMAGIEGQYKGFDVVAFDRHGNTTIYTQY